MVYPEGTVVDTDTQSVYSVIQQYPETVIFTELGGTSQVRGVMKLISEINIDWVKPYFSNMVKVDLFKLARIEFQQRGRDAVQERRQKKLHEQEKQKEQEEKLKLEKHQLYYLIKQCFQIYILIFQDNLEFNFILYFQLFNIQFQFILLHFQLFFIQQYKQLHNNYKKTNLIQKLKYLKNDQDR